MERNLREIEDEIMSEAESYLREALEPVLEESQSIVPRDTGELRDSAFLSVERSGRTITATLGYDCDHAWEVHERMDVEHPDGKQAKFLEVPWLQGEADVRDSIKDELAAIGIGSAIRPVSPGDK
jgi:hypothetical protein